MAKIGLSHRISQQLLADFHECFSFGRGMYADYKTDIGFAVVQGMLLW